jgi:hypothetical protein
VDAFTVLFKRPISAETTNMATGEAVAHLNYLLFSQQAARERPNRAGRGHAEDHP